VSGTRAGDTPSTGTMSASGASVADGGSAGGGGAGRLAQPAANNGSEHAQADTRRRSNDRLTHYPA
jgi:hypothetical protein